MRRNLLSTLFIFISLLVAQAQSTVANLDKILTEKFSPNEPGAAVLVVHQGKVILRKGYGIADMDRKASIEPDMVFRIGSITKQFTSTAILKLVQEGKLSLQDDIARYLPDFKTSSAITIEQLLNHTSGIKSYTSVPERMTTDAKQQKITVHEMIRYIQSYPSDFAPGEQWLYNNSAYFLLGAVIEKVTGKTYNDYLSKTFFKPLGMKSTYPDDSTPISKQAVGYTKTSGATFKVADYVHPSIPYSAGSIFSTVDDLYKWNSAVFSYKLVKQDLLEKAWTPTKTSKGGVESYGYGWQLGKVGNNKAIGHGGGIDGFVSFELYMPAQKIFVCILANTGFAIEDIAYTLAEEVAGLSKEKPAAIELNAARLDQYVGVYKIDDQGERVISRKGNQLYSQRTGGTKFEIYPIAENTFAFNETNSQLHFEVENGVVTAMKLVGRSFVDQRAVKTSKAIPQEREAFDFNPADFDVFSGEYELAPGFIIRVWREENVYKTQATGQQAFEIFPESATKFFLKVVDAQLEFMSNQQGEVTNLVLYQGGRSMPGKKVK
jgi:CubicO group peptidase (beta-lactamase class C family)